MNKIIAGLIAILAIGFGSAFGQTVTAGAPENPGFYAQFQMMYKHDTKADDTDMFVKQLYIEQSLDKKISIFALTYNDKEFTSVLVGPAYKWGDLQLGLGIGQARYDQLSRAMINPWAYYAEGKWEAFVSYERYAREKADPSFWKGYVKHKLSEKFFVGLYGETLYGVGPMVGLKFGSITLWVTHRGDNTFLNVSLEYE